MFHSLRRRTKKLKTTKSTIDTCRFILQAVANSKSFLRDKNPGVAEKDKGECRPKDFRINDAFNVRCFDNKVIVMYQIETANPLVPKLKFVTDAEAKFKEFVVFLKSEYKKVSGETLGLTKVGECKERVESMSLIRQIRTYACVYEIAGMPSRFEEASDEVEKHRDNVMKHHEWLYRKE